MSRKILVLISVGVCTVAGAGALALRGWIEPETLPQPFRDWFREPSAAEEALAGDPANPFRWCDLGEKLAEEGDLEGAKRCMRRAAELGPNSPPVLMRVANFWMSEGDNAAAMDLMARVLVQTDAFDAVVFGYYRRLGIPFSDVAEQGLPEDRRTWEAYFQSLLGWTQPAAVALAWNSLRDRGWNSDESAASYVGYLVEQELLDEAVATLAEQMGDQAGEFPDGNRVFNGRFDLELNSGGALGWQVRPVSGARAERVQVNGNWALRIEFDGTRNVVFRHVAQRLCLPPGTWRFRARIRTDRITTDEGFYVRISGDRPDLVWRSRKLNGSNDGWVDFELTNQATNTTLPVTLTLARDESLRIDNKLSGTVWLDDVEARPGGSGDGP